MFNCDLFSHFVKFYTDLFYTNIICRKRLINNSDDIFTVEFKITPWDKLKSRG